MRDDLFECSLNELLEIERGGSPRPIKDYITEDKDAINWIKIGDTKGVTKYIKRTKEKIKAAGLKKTRLVKPGDLILSNSMSFGRPYIMETTGAIHDGWLVLRDKSSVLNKEFLFHALSSPVVFNQFNRSAKGSTVRNLNIGLVSRVKINLVSLPEQRAIVAKIEKLFSDLDNGIANLKKAQDQLKVYRQAVLKKAFEGELTKEWRAKQTDLPTADELLLQIKEDFELLVVEKKKKKEKPLNTINSEDIPHSIPINWSWCNLGDIAWFINGDRGKNYPNKSEYVASGIPWINTGHIEPNGSLSAERMNYITQTKFDSLRSGKIQSGDLVYCLRGATFGKTAYVEPYTEGSIASSLMIIRTNEKISKVYLYHFLTSVEGKKQLQRFDNGTAQPNLSANMVRSYAFPLASTEEQQQIVQEIESRLSVCDKVEESIAESLEKAEALRQSILKKAFEGKLLTKAELQACRQEPDWEPAEKLLERIKGEKENV